MKNNNERRIMMISEHADPLAKPGSKEAGGQNVYVHDLAKGLARLGWKVDIFTRWDNRSKKQVVRFAKRCRVIRVKSGPRQYVPRDHLFKHLPEFVDNIIAFKREHDLDYKIIHAHYWMSGWSGLKLSELWSIPLTTTYHSLGYVRFHTLKIHKEQKADTDFFKFRVKWERKVAHDGHVLSTSPFEKKDLLKYYNVPKNNIKVITAGIDLSMFKQIEPNTAESKTGILNNQRTILYAGRLEWRKGIGTLIHAIPHVLKNNPELRDNLKLVIVGRHSAGPENKEYKRLKSIIEELKIKKYVDFVGSRDRSAMKYYYSSVDVCAVPSYYEPFGLVPLEAFACGCPVVASKVGGLQYTVKHKVNGQLVRPRNPKSLAKALSDVLNDNSKYKNRVKDFAENELVNTFSWEAVSEEMEKYYASLNKVKITMKEIT